MKLTKQKLQQLILQEMQYYRPPEFDSRAEKNYPDYAQKLSNLYKQDPEQAKSLAGSLDEPIDVEVPLSMYKDEDFLPAGIRQFEQNSYVTFDGITFGFVEFFYNTDSKEFIVAYYKGPSSTGGFEFMPKLSKEFSNSKEAIEYYNKFADNKYIEKSIWQTVHNML